MKQTNSPAQQLSEVIKVLKEELPPGIQLETVLCSIVKVTIYDSFSDSSINSTKVS